MSIETALLIHTLTPSTGFALFCLGLTAYMYLTKHRHEATVLVISLVLTAAIVIVMKYGLAIPRPDGALIDAGSYAFPSSHAALSAFFAAFVSWLVLQRPFSLYIKILLILAAIFSAAYINISRLVLHVHIPFQIAVGILIGTFVTVGVIRYCKNTNL